MSNNHYAQTPGANYGPFSPPGYGRGSYPGGVPGGRTAYGPGNIALGAGYPAYGQGPPGMVRKPGAMQPGWYGGGPGNGPYGGGGR